jgi:hypothetical protein
MAGGVLRRRREEAAPEAVTAAASVTRLPERRASSAAYSQSRAIVAAAEQVDLEHAWQERASASYKASQEEAWVGYGRVGEVHYGFNLVANVLSRLRVYPATVPESDEAPQGASEAAKKGRISSDLARDAEEVMRQITGPGFSRLVSSFSLNLNVPGECYLIRLTNQLKDGTKTVEWKIVSTDELTVDINGAVLRPIRGETSKEQRLPKGTYIARIWRPHPRYSGEPDSSLMGVADAVEELLILQRLVRSATRSRLNNGLLFLPNDLLTSKMQLAMQGLDETGKPLSEEQLAAMTEDPGNQLVADLLQAIVTAISDEGDVSAVAPLMVTGEGGLGDQIKHITFARSSDDWLVNRTERALERILQGIDVPKEVVTGLADVKYSNALVIDENLYKANIEPLALVLVDALTEVYLRPMLRAKGYSEADLDRIVVWYDPSEIVTRPNQANDASEGYDRMVLGPHAWRREHGFGDDDAPTEAELGMMLLTSGVALPPDVQMALLQALLPKVLGKQREESIQGQPVPFPTSAQDALSPTAEATANVSDAATGANAA